MKHMTHEAPNVGFDDFEQWEQQFAGDSPEAIPYGADMLLDLSPTAVLGVLACINALETQVDDNGSHTVDDFKAEFVSRITHDDVTSLS